METKDSVQDCLDFFTKGFPESGPKNFRTQLGIHLEELAEMLATLDGTNTGDSLLIGVLQKAIHDAGEHFKNTEGDVVIRDRIAFLDGVCDQMVTAIGLGRHAHMDIVGAFKEVNRSNNSKFGENGEPLLDKNLKLMKGPNYSKPDLKPFV